MNKSICMFILGMIMIGCGGESPKPFDPNKEVPGNCLTDTPCPEGSLCVQGKVCQPLCYSDADCVSGCCAQHNGSTAAVCAPALYCTGSCVHVGGDCGAETQTAACCNDGKHGTLCSGDGKCYAICFSNSDCDGKFCESVKDAPYGACL